MRTVGASVFMAKAVIVFLLLANISFAATLNEWQSRSIYQVLTDRFNRDGSGTSSPCAVELGLYCGGSWQGIRQNLDYIQGMNFDAIWISPVVAQLPQRTADGEAYTAYWQQDLYALNDHFGTGDDLRELINDVHSRGMYLMLDVVVNHMGYAGSSSFVDYGIFDPFNDEKYFHEYTPCNQDNNQTNVEVCWLGDSTVSLVDIRTEDSEVQDMYGDWISGMVKNYSVDGLRIDTSYNVEPSFFPNFVNSAGVFATGEVLQGDCSLACNWAKTIGSILNYPIYFPLIRAFQSAEGSIGDLVQTINSIKAICGDPTAFGSFSENHDVPRFASYTDDLSLAKNIIAYTIMSDGIPIIYQGQEQHMKGGTSPFYNRSPLWETAFNTSAPLYEHIATLNMFRQHAFVTSTNYSLYMNEVIYQDLHSMGMRKGFDGSQVVTVLNNNGAKSDDFVLHLQDHGFEPETRLTEILTCTALAVDQNGILHVPMHEGKPKVIYPTQLMENSSLCDSGPANSLTTISTSYSTTIHDHPTVVPTTTVSTISGTERPPNNTGEPSATAAGATSRHHIRGSLVTILVSTVGAAVALEIVI